METAISNMPARRRIFWLTQAEFRTCWSSAFRTPYRNRDMIPFAAGSGSENFLKFLTTELIPKLDHDFRTQPHRIIVGHSFGGLFGLYSLIKAPGVFKGYILASPTLEGDNRELARTVGSFLEAAQGSRGERLSHHGE